MQDVYTQRVNGEGRSMGGVMWGHARGGGYLCVVGALFVAAIGALTPTSKIDRHSISLGAMCGVNSSLCGLT